MFLVVIAALIATVSVNAQSTSKWSIMGRYGGNLSTVTNSINDESKYSYDMSSSLAVDYMVTKNLALALEINHDYLGAKSKGEDQKLVLNYFSMPVLAKIYATKWLAFEVGPQVGYLVKAKMGDTKITDSCERVEFSIPIGVSFEPNLNILGDGRMLIDLRYHLGLSKVNKYEDVSQRNNAFIFTLGYKFGL